MDELYEPLLHNGVESARGFVENKNLRVGHKSRNDREFSLHAEAHSLHVAEKGRLVEFEKFEKHSEPLVIVNTRQVLHHFQKLFAGKPRRQGNLSGNVPLRFSIFRNISRKSACRKFRLCRRLLWKIP